MSSLHTHATEDAQQGLDMLFQKFQEQDLEALRLQKKVLLLARLALTIRELAPVDVTARQLLKVLEDDGYGFA